MSLFPVFLKLEGKDVVVVGAGAVARPKIEQLLAAGAKVRVIAGENAKASQIDDCRLTIGKTVTAKDAEERKGRNSTAGQIDDCRLRIGETVTAKDAEERKGRLTTAGQIDDWRLTIEKAVTAKDAEGRKGTLRWEWREFEPQDVVGAALVIAATGKRAIDRGVYQVCRERGVWCNAVDDPEYCDFYTPAVVRRGDLQIAVSTNGRSPALAQQIRQKLDQQFGEAWAQKVEELGRRRRELLATTAPGAERIALLHEQAREALEQEVRSGSDATSEIPVFRSGAA